MKKLLSFVALASLSLSAAADIFAVYRNPDGTTKWQFIANTTASILIIALCLGLVFLVRAHLRTISANRALRNMKATLEERVIQRTAVLQETTEQLQEREAYITSIVNSMPVMLIGLDQELAITQWNKKAEEVTGRPFADVVGKNLWDAYSKITLTQEQVASVLASGKTQSLKHSQRGQYSFDITIYPLDSKNTGLVILISDVTKQASAESKLAERDKVSAMGELASAMAYDISLPINTIFARVSSARQEIEAADLGDIKDFLLQEVETVRASAHQAKAIAENLLELSRSHKGTKQLASAPALMDSAIALAGDLFSDGGGLHFGDIQLERHYAAQLPQVPCYPAELQQVFVRLLRSAFHALNAQDWSHDKKPAINIEIGEFFDSLWIKIAHNGKSLGPQEQLDVFEPYFALSQTPSTCPVEQRLSYSYFIITDHHRGQMAVTSSDEQGTCFNIQLALA